MFTRLSLDVLRELRRVLVSDGLLIATVPFVWEEHESPYDFFRYAKNGLEHLLKQAGFDQVEVRPRTDCFTTLAPLDVAMTLPLGYTACARASGRSQGS